LANFILQLNLSNGRFIKSRQSNIAQNHEKGACHQNSKAEKSETLWQVGQPLCPKIGHPVVVGCGRVISSRLSKRGTYFELRKMGNGSPTFAMRAKGSEPNGWNLMAFAHRTPETITAIVWPDFIPMRVSALIDRRTSSRFAADRHWGWYDLWLWKMAGFH